MTKSKIILIPLLVLFAGGTTVAQDNVFPPAENPELNTYSIGMRGLHLYDLPGEQDLDTDMKGLNGSKTSMDIGFDIYGEKQFSPLLGIQVGFRYATLSGSNNVEYYRNNFFEMYADLVVALTNNFPQILNERFNIYVKMGMGSGTYNARQYLKFDNAMDDAIKAGFWEGHFGPGLNYTISNSFRLELEVVYNVAFTTGMDGYYSGISPYPYLTTAVGVAYTFGKRDRKPMYAATYISKKSTNDPTIAKVENSSVNENSTEEEE